MSGISRQVPSSTPTASDPSRNLHTHVLLLSFCYHSNSTVNPRSSSFRWVTEASLASLALWLPTEREAASGSWDWETWTIWAFHRLRMKPLMILPLLPRHRLYRFIYLRSLLPHFPRLLCFHHHHLRFGFIRHHQKTHPHLRLWSQSSVTLTATLPSAPSSPPIAMQMAKSPSS